MYLPKEPEESWATHQRSLVVTVGLFFIAVGPFISGDVMLDLTSWAYYLVLLGFSLIGLAFLGVGLLADNEKVEKWGRAAELGGFGGLVILFASLPVYLLMRLFEKKH